METWLGKNAVSAMTLEFYGQIPEYLKPETAFLGVTARMHAGVNNFETVNFQMDSNNVGAFCVYLLLYSSMISEAWKNIYHCYNKKAAYYRYLYLKLRTSVLRYCSNIKWRHYPKRYLSFQKLFIF
jgi:hypothetical protein